MESAVARAALGGRATWLTIALIAVVACSPDADDGDVDADRDSPPFIEGVVEPAGTGRVLVHGRNVRSADSVAYVDVSESTRLVWRDGRPARRIDLTPGRVVAVWTRGPTNDTYPVQVEAALMVLERSQTP